VNCPSQFQKGSQYFIRTHNETLSISQRAIAEFGKAAQHVRLTADQNDSSFFLLLFITPTTRQQKVHIK
jgi:hypothetical protein